VTRSWFTGRTGRFCLTAGRGSRLAAIVLVLPLLLLVPACCQFYDVPDQTHYTPLDVLAGRPEAVVRTYAAPIIGLGPFAVHTWLVTKRKNSSIFHRWEIWLCPGGDYGYVCVDYNALPTPGGSSYVVGELIGPDAEPVVDFIERAAPVYPYENKYIALPGPNSNTFTQWMLNESGWGLQLGTCAVGAQWTPVGGWPEVQLSSTTAIP